MSFYPGSTTLPPEASTSTAAAPPTKRVSKACEPCRVRRVRCDGGTPCNRCTAAGGLVCTYRLKARPSRRPRLIRPYPLAPSQHCNDAEDPPVPGMRGVEADLERLYRERTGTRISLALPDVDTHPSLALTTPLPSLPSVSNVEAEALCDVFVRDVLPFFSFLSPSRLRQLVQRHREMPSTLTADQLALLYTVYSLGYLRRAIFGQGIDVGPVVIAPTDARADVAFFRHALELAQDASSITALQALLLLQLYSMVSASVSTTRHLISKICYAVQELGLLEQNTASAYPPECDAPSLLFYAVWSDVYYAGLSGYPPFLRDVDMTLLAAAAENGGIVGPAMAQLVLLEANLLREGHENPRRLRDPLLVLQHDAKLFAFLKEFGSQANDCSNMASSFTTVHYHFQCLLLRAPSSTDPILGLSSLAVLSQSAVHLLQHYVRVFTTTRYINAAWPVLARVVAAGHAVLQALWHGSIVRLEADSAMTKVLWLLERLGVRWAEAAAVAHGNFVKLMTVLELDLSTTLDYSNTVPDAAATSSSSPAPASDPTLPAAAHSVPQPAPEDLRTAAAAGAAAYETFFNLHISTSDAAGDSGTGVESGCAGDADGGSGVDELGGAGPTLGLVQGEMQDFWDTLPGWGGATGADEALAQLGWWQT
ncbi:hypothetical protein JCM3770_005897 [Rhodotorula araucariae]